MLEDRLARLCRTDPVAYRAMLKRLGILEAEEVVERLEFKLTPQEGPFPKRQRNLGHTFRDVMDYGGGGIRITTVWHASLTDDLFVLLRRDQVRLRAIKRVTSTFWTVHLFEYSGEFSWDGIGGWNPIWVSPSRPTVKIAFKEFWLPEKIALPELVLEDPQPVGR